MCCGVRCCDAQICGVLGVVEKSGENLVVVVMMMMMMVVVD